MCFVRQMRVARAPLGSSLALLGVLACILAACDSGGATSTPSATTGTSTTGSGQIPSVTVAAHDYSFDLPDNVPGGLVTFKFTNDGKEPHQANLVRLKDGVTKDQFETTVKSNPNAALPMVTFVGGPNTVDPGATQTVTLELKQPGTYEALCFVSSADGKSHIMKGMLKAFTVAAATQPQPTEPTNSGVVALRDFAIDVPAAAAGTVTWKVWNEGTQPHEMSLIKLASGKTMQDAIAFLSNPQPSGPPPFTDAGGIGALAPNASGWAELNLSSGHYVALCFVPDPGTGKAHFMLGMMKEFDIA